jgi:DNA-binding transcriptional LysR family regulator
MIRDLTPIQHALALAQTRNFARAAEIVHITQPAFSRSIATLERELGVRLFDRLTSGVELTAFGKLLIERGAQLIGDVALIKREIELLGGLHTGSLAVAAGPYTSESLVGRVAAQLLSTYPGLSVSVESMDARDVIRGVLDARIDVGVASSARVGKEPRLVIEALESHAIHLVCRAGHPLCRQKNLTLQHVLSFPIVSGHMGGDVAQFARISGASGAFDADTGEFQPTIQVNSMSLARAIVYQSDAVLPATLDMVEDEIDTGRLVRLDIDALPVSVRPCQFYRRGRTPSPAALTFMEMLRQSDAQMASTSTPSCRRRQSARRSTRKPTQ